MYDLVMNIGQMSRGCMHLLHRGNSSLCHVYVTVYNQYMEPSTHLLTHNYDARKWLVDLYSMALYHPHHGSIYFAHILYWFDQQLVALFLKFLACMYY